MGLCLSTTRVSGSNSNNNNNNNVNHPRKDNEEGKRGRNETTQRNPPLPVKNTLQLKAKKDKANAKRQTGVIPCGKRADFGYAKDFDERYSTGKLLGHGQFGYTYVATDKTSGDRVAVKKIEKNKVRLAHFMNWVLLWRNLILLLCGKK